MQLNPGESYKVNRILKDWADNTTYYVQAKVYEAAERTLLDTLNLTDNGNRWFSKDYRVPHDNVFGTGKRLIIITSVYTNAGYTTRSNNHYDEVEEILVQQRWNPSVNFGGGDGGYDHKAIIKEMSLLLDKKLAALAGIELEEGSEFPIKLQLPESVDTNALATGIVNALLTKVEESTKIIRKDIAALPKPKDPEKVNFEPILTAISQLSGKIGQLPQPEKVNFAPLLIEITRKLAALQAALTEEIGTQTSKELTLSFSDAPEVIKGNKKKALLSGLRTKYYGKSS